MKLQRYAKALLMAAWTVALIGGNLAGATLTDGLVAYYPFDAGGTYDESGYNNHGTIDGSVTPQEGIVGGGMLFNGQGVITAPDKPQIDLAGNLSFQVWFKTSSTSRMGLLGKIYAWPYDVFPYYCELIQVNSVTKFYPYIDGAEWNGDDPTILFGNALNDNEWHHAIVTFDDAANVMKVYIDGVYKGDGGTQDELIADEVNDYPLVIGALLAGDSPSYYRVFNGSMDEIAIWNRVLTENEVTALYNNGQGRPVSSVTYPVSPQHHQTGVAPTASLHWETVSSGSGQSYDIYLAGNLDPNQIDPNNLPLVASGLATKEFDPDGELGFDFTYRWRIVTHIPGQADQTSPAWTFVVRSDTPFIATQPLDIHATPNGIAQFTIQAESTTDMTYAWYRQVGTEPTPATDPQIFDQNAGTPEVLDLASVQLADEGYYYCVVSNNGGSVTSSPAFLTIDRIIATWEFDQTLADSTGNGWDGQMSHGATPVYESGLSGTALNLADTHEYVYIPDSNQGFEFLKRGYTLSVWINTTTGGWNGVLTKSTRASGTAGGVNYASYKGIVITQYDGWAGHQIRGAGDYWGSNNINDGKWHMITATYRNDKWAEIYVDGLRYSTTGGPVDVDPTTSADTDQPFVIGNELTVQLENGDDVPFNGLIDNVQVYNYALSQDTIADMYLAYVEQEYLCKSRPEFDFNNDCITDLLDFAQFAQTWLECYRYPECLDTLE